MNKFFSGHTMICIRVTQVYFEDRIFNQSKWKNSTPMDVLLDTQNICYLYGAHFAMCFTVSLLTIGSKITVDYWGLLRIVSGFRRELWYLRSHYRDHWRFQVSWARNLHQLCLLVRPVIDWNVYQNNIYNNIFFITRIR